MSEFVLRPEEEVFSPYEGLHVLREYAADFMGRLVSQIGFDLEHTDADDVSGLEMEAETEPEADRAAMVTAASSEAAIVYAEEEKKDLPKKPKRPQRPRRDPPPTNHDPKTCTAVVCTACGRLGHHK
jgi:hypothetical protein